MGLRAVPATIERSQPMALCLERQVAVNVRKARWIHRTICINADGE